MTALRYDIKADTDPTGATLVSLTPEDFMVGSQVRVELNGSGSGTVKIQADHPAATEANFRKGNFVAVYDLDLAEYVAGFFMESGDFDAVGDQEEASRVLTFSGPGPLAYLANAVLWRGGVVGTTVVTGQTRRLPVFVDATIAYAPDTGFDLGGGADRHLPVGRGPSVDAYFVRSLLEFALDFTNVSAITDAHLYLYRATGYPAVYHGILTAPDLYIKRVTSGWAEGSKGADEIWWANNAVNWANQPSTTSTDQVHVTAGNAGWNAFDITAMVKKWAPAAAGGSHLGNFGIMLKETSANGTSHDESGTMFYEYESRENGFDPYILLTYDSGVTVSTGPRDDGSWHWASGGTRGAILEQILVEAQNPDGFAQPIPALTWDFDATVDSAGYTWETYEGELTYPIGTPYLDIISDFINAGITFVVGPDLILHAYQDAFGADRSGDAFGPSVVRFEAGVNIAAPSPLKRGLSASTRWTHMLVQGLSTAPDHLVAVKNPTYVEDAEPVHEGFLAYGITDDAGTLATAGRAHMALRDAATDTAVLTTEPADDPSAGFYQPGPSEGHYYLGDTVRLHTGVAAYDFDEVDLRVASITWVLRDAGAWEIVPELGATFINVPSAAGTSLSGGVPVGCTCPRAAISCIAGAGGFPEIRSTATGSGNGGLYTPSLPAGAVGDLILGLLAANGAPSITWPAGWTELAEQETLVGGTSQTIGIGYRFADGSEGSTITLTGPTGRMVWRFIRISGAKPATAPFLSSPAYGDSMAPNSTTATDPDGAESVLWITAAAVDWHNGVAFPGSYPTGWINTSKVQLLGGIGSGASATLISATKAELSDTQDPPAFAITGDSEQWVAYTIGIQPAGEAVDDPFCSLGLGYSLDGSIGTDTTHFLPPDSTIPYPPTLMRTLANASGGAVVAGDLVVPDDGADDAFTTTTDPAVAGPVWVAQEAIAAAESGKVAVAGYVSLVTVAGSVDRASFLGTSGTAGTAAALSAYGAGAAGVFLSTSATPDAVLFGSAPGASDGGGGGGGSGPDWRIPPWVLRPGSGQVTLAPEDRLTLDAGSGYKAFMDAALREGLLHLVYRHATDHQTTLDGVVKYRTSETNGRTWSSAVTIYDPAGSNDARDPYILAHSSGRLIVAITVAPATVANRKVYSLWSDNGGQDWTAPVEFTDHGFDNSPAVGHMIELKDGSVLMFCFGKIGASDTRYSATVVRSTDQGETWTYLATVATAPSTDSFEEPNAHLLSTGNLVALIRNGTDGHTYRSVSTDDGATWTAVADAHTMAGRPDFVEFYPGALLQIGRDNPSNQYARFATSWDEGANWSSNAEVDAGSTKRQMYAAPVVLGPGYVMAVYAEEQSSTDTDLFVRYWFAGYGIDSLGQARFAWVSTAEQAEPDTPATGTGIWYTSTDGNPTFKNDDGTVFDLSTGGGGRWEVIMADGVTDPPEPLYSEDGSDWLYGEVT